MNKRKSQTSSRFVQDPKNQIQLDKELDDFFENASIQGASFTKSLTPEQRAERAEKGMYLEEEIFDCRDRLMDMQNEFMSGNKEITIEMIKQLQDEIQGLKDDYILLVGAKDLPLYFGRAPDSFQ